MSKFIIVEGNSNDKDNVRVIMVKGEKGDPNSLSIGEVTETETAQATITGDAPNQTLNLGLPKADPNTLSIGTVTKGADASASITGDAPNQTLNLVLPKGDTGEQGPAGFEVPAGSVIGWDSSSAIPEGYEEIDTISTVVCQVEEPTDIDVFLRHQDNLFDKTTVTSGYYLNKTTGEPTSNADYGYSDYIDVSNYNYISIYSNRFPPSQNLPGYVFYDENKNYISGESILSESGSIHIPVGAKYIRYTILLYQLNTLKIVEGPVIVEDKIFVKNSNGQYEEFLNNNYSTTELPVGTWIDGRTIYRKTMNFSDFQSTYNMNIVGAKDIINTDIIVHRKDYDNMFHKLPCRLDDSSLKIDLQYLERTSQNVIAHLGWGSHYTSEKINNVAITVEYTRIDDIPVSV